MNFKKLIFATALTLSLAGCATSPWIETQITPFHDFGMERKNEMRIFILPLRSELNNSLEFKNYKKLITQKLLSLGYVVVEDSKPTHVMYVDYGIDNGKQVVSSYSIPNFGVTGYSGSSTSGTIRTIGSTGYINATTTNRPTYGITGYTRGVTTNTEYGRYFSIDIIQYVSNTQLGPKVYEGKLKSEGWCNNLTILAPLFIDSLFSEFPGQSGVLQKKTLDWNGEC